MTVPRTENLLTRERALWEGGRTRVAGVDEAGVGPLAGPVVAAAVVFGPGQFVEGVRDSKALSPARRERLAGEIRARSLAFAHGVVEPEEIDRLNIYRASLEAMRRAVESLAVRPDHVLVDARTIPSIAIPQEGIVRGDATCHAIAAASILAKVFRDAAMEELDDRFPGYGFRRHKGYPTVAHREAIRRMGPCPVHRKSFQLR
jgi:ribonuclease HII